MLQVVAEKKALKTINRYVDTVGKTGYVKHDVMRRMLLYLFFVDFVEYTHDYFTREDYDTVAEALSKLFSNGGCLLPYPVFCTNRGKVGRAHYMGAFNLRVTEGETLADRIKRATEDDDLRTAMVL